MTTIPSHQKSTLILDGYEGLSGFRNGKYYPYHGAADKAGLLTIGRGHLIKPNETGRFDKGLTLQQVDDLFRADVAPRADTLAKILQVFTEDQFCGALPGIYNCPEMWTYESAPTKYHLARDYRTAAEHMLLYILSDGKRELGLWRRRMTEALCYLSGKVIIASDIHTEAELIKNLSTIIPVVRPANLV